MKDIKFSELSQFQPKQLEAKEALKKYKYLLYGGAAGGGKSYWLRWMALFLLMYYHAKYDLKGVRVGLFCEDYPALKERHLSKIPFEFPEWLGTLNRSDHEFRLAPEFGSGIIAFRNLDDPSKYLSSEFASVLIDELTKNKRDIFDFLNMRMRWPGISDTKFLAATNPGDIGHGWVKKLWITRDFEKEAYDPEEFHFVQSFYSDNKYIDLSYEKQLNALPEQLRRAYKDGDWNIFAGQFFTEFRLETHVIEPFMIPSHWHKFMGLDYGFSNPSSVQWCAYDKAFDTIYVYHELHTKGLTYPELGIEINKHNEELDNWLIPAGAFECYPDPSIWAKKDRPRSGALDLIDECKRINFMPGKNDRVFGANAIRQRLKIQEGGQTKLKIFNTNKHLIRTLPELVHDDKNVEDVDSDGDDHDYDAVRYAIVSFLDKIFKKFKPREETGYRDPMKRINQQVGGYRDVTKL